MFAESKLVNPAHNLPLFPQASSIPRLIHQVYYSRDLPPAEQVERMSKVPLAHQPGTVWEYSLASDLLGRTYSVSGSLGGDNFTVDPQRALPRPGVYDAQLHQNNKTFDVSLTVLPTPGQIQLNTETPHHQGEATVTFLRRAD